MVGLVVAVVVLFVPPLNALFVSDTFVLYERAMSQSASAILRLYIPSASTWYRPTTDLVFWIEAHVFGTSPVGYHIVALGLHGLSVGLVFLLARRITGVQSAATAAALTFLFLPQLHEPVWDIADLHTVLSGAVLLGTVLSYASGRRTLAIALGIVGLTVDETGLLAVALVVLYELIMERHARASSDVRSILVRVAPFAIVAISYVGIRLVAGSIYSEVPDPCRDPKCLAVAAAEYFNRFWVRPDLLLTAIWTHRIQFGVLGGIVIIGIATLLQPWRWTHIRAVLFSLGWLAGASAFFVLTLWPYIPDRFLYIPVIGLALLLGVAVAEGLPWASDAGARRGGLVAAAALVAVWFGMGLPMLFDRGQAWIKAGQQASAIVTGVQRLVPDPPSGSVLAFQGVPDYLPPGIPPGNTGAYVFHNGLPEALRQAYGRGDFTVVLGEPTTPPGTTVYRFAINGSVVKLAP